MAIVLSIHAYLFIKLKLKKIEFANNSNKANLIFKKEYIWISSNEVDETGAYHTEWSKPERKTPIQYTNAYIYGI